MASEYVVMNTGMAHRSSRSMVATPRLRAAAEPADPADDRLLALGTLAAQRGHPGM